MTINKAQEQFFDKVGVYFTRTPFIPGQVYVALSRVRSMEKLMIKRNETHFQGNIAMHSYSYLLAKHSQQRIFFIKNKVISDDHFFVYYSLNGIHEPRLFLTLLICFLLSSIM